MQRVHLSDGVNFFDGEEYLLADHVRELYLDFEGLELTLSDPLEDNEEQEFTRNPYRKGTDDTFFVPFENVRGFDSKDDEYVGDVIARDKEIAFRRSLQMFGGASEIEAEKIIDRPLGVKVVRNEDEVVVPQTNIAMVEVDDGALRQG